MPITPVEVAKVIEDEDDFGFEMRVGAVLNLRTITAPRHGTNVELPAEHGGTYVDLITQKPRQYDYRCRIWHTENNPRHRLCLRLAIECKNLHDSSPLVIVGRPRTKLESYCNFVESQLVDRMAHAEIKEQFHLSGLLLYSRGEFVGKSVARLKREKQNWVSESASDVYDRWAQTLSSSIDLVQGAAKMTLPPIERITSFIMPIVVVPDETLWIANFDEDGKIAPEPTTENHTTFFVGREISIGVWDADQSQYQQKPFALSHVHFMTLRGLQDFMLALVVSAPRFWANLFSCPMSKR
jgi:hypothetical protein